MEDNLEIIKAIDRLACTILLSVVISRNDMKVTSIDQEALRKALADNLYVK